MLKALLYLFLFLLLLIVGFFFWQGQKSASLAPPPVTGKSLTACGEKPNCVSSVNASDSEYYVAPLAAGGADAFIARMAAAVEQTGGVVVQQTEGFMHATYTSGLFKFVDDLQVVVAEGDPGQYQLRSSSRVGYSDMGVNRKRVESLRSAINGDGQ